MLKLRKFPPPAGGGGGRQHAPQVLARRILPQSLQTRRLLSNITAMNTDRITLDPAVMSGKPCIRGLRVTAENILRQLANHRTPGEILAAYPYLESADIDACLSYAALRVEMDDRV